MNCTDIPAPPQQQTQPPQQTQPTQPTTPTSPTTPTTPTLPSAPPKKGGQTPTKPTKPKAKTRLGAKRVEDLGAQREQRKAKARKPDGVPTAVESELLRSPQPGPGAIGVPNFVIRKFRIPPFLLPIYQAAGIEYGVPWEILAAINEIETDYGRNLNVSSAGALGWMQFMPSSWQMLRRRRQQRRRARTPTTRSTRSSPPPATSRPPATRTTSAGRSSPTTTPTGTSTR